MKRHMAALAAGVAALTLTGGALLPSAAEEVQPPIAVEPLTGRSTFTDDVTMQLQLKLDGRRTNPINVGDPSRTVVARITVQPGARFPWHTHPGPVLVTVVTGELTFVNASDCVERVYRKDTTFVDPGRGNVHTAFNPSLGATELIAVFFEATDGGPLTITEGVEPPEDCDVGTATTHAR